LKGHENIGSHKPADDTLEKFLNKVCDESGKTRSEIAREVLQRQLKLLQFEGLPKEAIRRGPEQTKRNI